MDDSTKRMIERLGQAAAAFAKLAASAGALPVEMETLVETLKQAETFLKTDGWISTEERIPDLEVSVLAFGDDWDTPFVGSRDEKGFHDIEDIYYDVSHWQPLPGVEHLVKPDGDSVQPTFTIL